MSAVPHSLSGTRQLKTAQLIADELAGLEIARHPEIVGTGIVAKAVLGGVQLFQQLSHDEGSFQANAAMTRRRSYCNPLRAD